MKASMKLTLDDLLRALRTRMHQIADDIETGALARRSRQRDRVATGPETGAVGNDIRGD